MTETGTIRLTSLSHGAGCACKLPLAALEELMSSVGSGLGAAGGDLLVGAAEGDDAAVLRIDDRRALVLTTDFFTPIVDDARDWGRVAAANALSDVYAMGGRPLIALNLTAWPAADLPMELLAEVLRGGAEIAAEAGCLVVGGHSIDDPEPKYGMAVVGMADPERLLTVDRARPGDQLVLTKPIGTGVVATALKRGSPDPAVVAAAGGAARSSPPEVCASWSRVATTGGRSGSRSTLSARNAWLLRVPPDTKPSPASSAAPGRNGTAAASTSAATPLALAMR